MDIEGKLPGINSAEEAAKAAGDGGVDTAGCSTPKPQDVSKPKDTSKLKKVFENDGYNKMNEAIGRMLGRLRKEHNMTVKDVKQRLHDDYGVDVAEKTLYNWESNQAHPTTERMLMLLDIYEVDDILEALDGEQSDEGEFTKANQVEKYHEEHQPIIITEEEKAFIEAYRAKPEKHETVLRILGIGKK